MTPTQRSTRRPRSARFAPEALESRALLTGGAGSTFAIDSGTIAAANTPTAIKFTIDPSHFTIPKGRLTLGIDVVGGSSSSSSAATTSTIKPLIATVLDPNGRPLHTTHATYAANLPSSTVAAGQPTSAVLTTIHLTKAELASPQTFTVNVIGVGGTTGPFLLGFYLPGDANGDGTVNQTDVNAIKAAMGTKGGNTKYNFDADANRDGRVQMNDLAVARQNLGVSTTINPNVSANLDPASVNTLSDATTTNSSVHFTGNVTPGASVTYVNTSAVTPSATATADGAGNYTLNVAVAPGSNVFNVTTKDAFGQSISGNINPVTMDNQPAVTPATLPTATDATMSPATGGGSTSGSSGSPTVAPTGTKVAGN